MKREQISVCVCAGARAAQYSANTRTMTWFNHRNKRCAVCKMARSLAQFAANDDHCAQCRRRAA